LNLRIGIADNRVEGAPFLLFGNLASVKHSRPAEYRVHGGAKLMRQHCEKFVFRSIGRLRLFSARLGNESSLSFCGGAANGLTGCDERGTQIFDLREGRDAHFDSFAARHGIGTIGKSRKWRGYSLTEDQGGAKTEEQHDSRAT